MKIEVLGKPQGKARPRFYHGHAVTPKETKEYEKRIALIYRLSGGKCLTKNADEPVRVNVTMVFTPMKSDTKRVREDKLAGKIAATKKPDNDNCLKVVQDALQGGIAFHDDKQVVDSRVTKVFGEEEKLIIEVEVCSNDEQ